MANLQDDIEAGIVKILKVAAFDAVLSESRTAANTVQSGLRRDDNPFGKYNDIRVISDVQETPPETMLDDSGFSQYTYDIEFIVKSLSSDNDKTLNAMNQLMTSKFGDNGTNLSANITDADSNILDQVLTILGTPTTEPTDERGKKESVITYTLQVDCWHKMPLA